MRLLCTWCLKLRFPKKTVENIQKSTKSFWLTLKLQEITDTLQISKKCLSIILQEHLSMREHFSSGLSPKTSKNASWWGYGIGILFIDCLEKGLTININNYVTQMVHLKKEIPKKTRYMEKKKMVFTKTMYRIIDT